MKHSNALLEADGTLVVESTSRRDVVDENDATSHKAEEQLVIFARNLSRALASYVRNFGQSGDELRGLSHLNSSADEHLHDRGRVREMEGHLIGDLFSDERFLGLALGAG